MKQREIGSKLLIFKLCYVCQGQIRCSVSLSSGLCRCGPQLAAARNALWCEINCLRSGTISHEKAEEKSSQGRVKHAYSYHENVRKCQDFQTVGFTFLLVFPASRWF